MAADPDCKITVADVDALLRLSSEQRDYMSLEKTDVGPWDLNKREVAELFRGVRDPDYLVLKKAHLKGRGKHMRIFSLQKYDASLTAEAFQGRDKNNDLLAIVQSIENEI